MGNKNYFLYHLHSDYSSCVTNIDSATKVQMYVDRAVECGMTSLAFSEHGSVLNWQEKKSAIEKAGMKYIHAMEAYLTESIEEKVRDNYHIVLLAKNYEGFKEINRLMTKSFNRDDGHFYYVPRILVDDLLNTSENIIVTSACLASPISKGDEALKNKIISWMIKHKDRCFLEIQHHNVERQKQYNQYLYELSLKTGIRLIAGTDTHSLNQELAEARVILQRAKNTFFSDEDGWDLTFKTYEELVEDYKVQNSIPFESALEAIDNTNLIPEMVEEFVINTDPKFPDLYKNVDEVFRAEIYKCIDSHPYALKNHTRDELLARCN